MLFVGENKWIPFFMFVGAKEKIAFGSYFGAIYLVGFQKEPHYALFLPLDFMVQ